MASNAKTIDGSQKSPTQHPSRTISTILHNFCTILRDRLQTALDESKLVLTQKHSFPQIVQKTRKKLCTQKNSYPNSEKHFVRCLIQGLPKKKLEQWGQWVVQSPESCFGQKQ